MSIMVRVCIVMLFASAIQQNEAFNLRSKDAQTTWTQVHKESSEGERPIPDPTCKKGVMSPDMKVCCTDECGSCGNHKLCSNVGKYNEVTGKLADNCCKDRILKKAVSCDKNHAPCVLSASYKESIDKYVIDTPKRHAGSDCNKAVPIARARHALAIDKGEFFSRLHVEGQTKYEEAQAMAIKVEGLCRRKTIQSADLVKEYSGKIAEATAEHKLEDPLSGASKVDQWKDARETEESEIEFYEMIVKNAKQVDGAAEKGILNVKSLKAEVEKAKDIPSFLVKLNSLTEDANEVHNDAELLWKQWLDSSKDYHCGVPPAVNHAKTQCSEGNTKFSRKCEIACERGYDGNGTQNALRCNRQGKFGKQLYGEWMGMASCVGRMCGKPPTIAKAKTVMQDIRYPHLASYVCYEGFSTDRTASGPKAFDKQCDHMGSFVNNASHVCKAITCGVAPAMKNTHNIDTEFFYTEVAAYDCMDGHTVDAMPGGLKTFSRTCQASGKFTEGQGCHPVRCGPPLTFDNTKLDSGTKKDQYYGDELRYTCNLGHTVDQSAQGPDHFTLTCQADGQFALDGSDGDAPLPKCRPVSAGIAAPIPHGNFNPREMFYGEAVLVTGDIGYTTSGKATDGFSIELSVTADGQYAGRKKFQPVVCGKAPSVVKAKTSFNAWQATYGDLLSYDCADGFSTDMTDAQASKSFSIQCEADGSFSQVAGLGKCVNIDDCADHTCGPHGDCVDHLKNYTCACQSGFEQTLDPATNELVCGNINDCGPEACGVGECIDLVEGYKCECPTGYEVFSEEDEDGKNQHTCMAVNCGTAPGVDNSATTPVDAQLNKAYYTNKVVYQCDVGHTLDGTAVGRNHFDIECLASKQFTATKECQPIKCDNIPQVAMGTPSEDSGLVFNESLRYDCAKGHTVDGTDDGDRGFTVTCLVTGEFGEPQACKPVICGEPDSVANANRPSGSLVFGQSVKYSCFDGFTLDGTQDGKTEFSSECHEDGQLDKLKQCLPKVCGEPTKEINILYASTKDEGVIKYPQTTEILCRDGFTVGGDVGGATAFQVTCLASGVFERVDKRECQPVKCGAPPAMPNATLLRIDTPSLEPIKKGLTRETFYNMKIDKSLPDVSRRGPDAVDVVDNINVGSTGGAMPGLAHKDNFVLRFSGSLMVKKGGDYEFELTSDDGSVLYIHGNRLIDNDGLHGMVSKKGGEKLDKGPNALTVEFFEKGGGTGIILKWKGPDSGDKWQVVPQSAFQTKGANLNYEEKAIYQCATGFTTGGEYNAPTTFKVECLPSGELSAPSADMQCRNVDDCEQHTCGKKGKCVDLIGPAPAYTCDCDDGYEIQVRKNGEKYCGNVDDCQGRDCGVGVCMDLVGDYTCNCPSGYYIGFQNGQKTCIAVQCSADTPTLAHGKLLSSHSGAVDFPTTLRYKCNKGYSVDGSVSDSKRYFQGQCKSDGQMLGMMSCQKITCGTPHVLPFVKLLSPGSPRRSIEYDDKAKYECITGYTTGGRVGNPTKFEVKCQDDGILTDPEVCEPVKCGTAPRVSKMRPSIAGAVYFGQHLIYRCDLGYTFDRTPGGRTEVQRHCLSDGTFSNLAPAAPCKAITPGNAPSVRNAVLKEYAGRRVRSSTVRVFYPNGLEYRCKPGYSTNGASSGPTKITARVNSIGRFSPALPAECKLIVFSIRGQIKSARTGRRLTGVKVTIVGAGNRATSRWGFFTLRGIRAGTVKVVYEKSGYIKTEKVLSINGNVYSGSVADVAMSPTMANDQWRAVVKWNRRPSDLDSYATWGWSKVCWYGRRKYSNGIKGVLEQDKTAGYGPETVYLTGMGRCRGGSRFCDVKFWVNDYTRSGRMAREGAEVTLFTGSRQAGTWKISDCPRSVKGRGNWWHVFTLDAKTNRLKWNCKGASLAQVNASSEDISGLLSAPPVVKPRLKIRSIAQ